jgi:predicted transcriptional regulator
MKSAEFKKIRRDKGLSLSELSDIIGVHTRTIRRYEDGSTPISRPVAIIMGMIDRNRIGYVSDCEKDDDEFTLHKDPKMAGCCNGVDGSPVLYSFVDED